VGEEERFSRQDAKGAKESIVAFLSRLTVRVILMSASLRVLGESTNTWLWKDLPAKRRP